MKEIQGKIDDHTIIKDSKNKKIMLMNTKYNRRNNMTESIEAALTNGTHVKLLLMHKDNDCSSYRGRDSCADHLDENHVNHRIEDYNKNLEANFNEMLDFYRRMKESVDIIGKFELRFYKDMPSIPIIIVEKGERYEEAYSGFYLTKYSSANPYIRWTNKGDGFIDSLYDYFERKWYFSEEFDAENLLQTTAEE